MLSLKAMDAQGEKEITELKFYAEGGTQTIYIKTVTPYWRALIKSNIDAGEVDTHPTTGFFPDEYIEIKNIDDWMTIKYKHAIMNLFNGYIEVTVDEVTPGSLTGGQRDDSIYIWNDDFPKTLLGVFVNVVQVDEAAPE